MCVRALPPLVVPIFMQLMPELKEGEIATFKRKYKQRMCAGRYLHGMPSLG